MMPGSKALIWSKSTVKLCVIFYVAYVSPSILEYKFFEKFTPQ